MSAEPVTIPVKLECLFKPSRYKILYGGRGGGKSHSIAKALLVHGCKNKLRILCAREIQKSIKQSVHTLLSDQIELLGLSSFYEILDTEIRGLNGTSFTFTGLNVHTVDSIKSFEGVDICWVEEAHTVSNRSWKILIPTIRKDGSEIWVSMNPELDTDNAYQRFIVSPPPDATVVEMNYSDNPWFSSVLEDERKHAKATLTQDEYQNIWLGKCKTAVEGAIYANEIRDAIEKRRIRDVPYDSMLKVHVVCDLGWNDSMFISLVQRDMSALRIIHCIEDSHRQIPEFSAELRDMKLNWGKLWLPAADGDTGNIQSGGLSARAIFKKLGWDAVLVDKHTVEQGIRVARMTFQRVFFNKDSTAPLVNALKRYRRVIPKSTGEEASPLHDQYSHGADCFRYICMAADKMTNDDRAPAPKPMRAFRPADPGMGYVLALGVAVEMLRLIPV